MGAAPPLWGATEASYNRLIIHQIPHLTPSRGRSSPLEGELEGGFILQHMKSVFIAYDQAYQEKILFTLDHFNCRGFSMFPQIQGRGSKTGEPHYGSHAWPSMCSAILTVVRDEQVDPLLEELHRIDKQTERLGLRAFVWDVEKSI